MCTVAEGLKGFSNTLPEIVPWDMGSRNGALLQRLYLGPFKSTCTAKPLTQFLCLYMHNVSLYVYFDLIVVLHP